MDNKPKVVQSTSIQSYDYDDTKYTLTVTFKNGTEYTYKGVKPDVMSNVFDSSGSLGRKFYKLIGQKVKGTKQ